MFNWDEPAVDSLKRLRSEGLSASEIATVLGTTRNAVCGKAHRLGIPFSPPKKFGQAGGTPQAARAAATARSAGSRKPEITLAPSRPKPLVLREPEKVSIWIAPPVPAPQPGDFGPRTILDLGRRHCRFPLFKGHEPIDQKFYCGEPKFDGSYCMHHASLCSGTGTPAERRAHLEAAE
ncbi:GcrA family cell cycle regulator [Labrys sedimenti]|uniref:GcrA family cell cycle regulator n=1 Tax=Labrys sedimenti TaxID=3106036 RepID=UPI002ACA6482|nr:GcrA family cell cycle regulator [Labrys sp. ZIDIC5]MDZ5448912.1 GcrA family cell cycle regulator [Labrys sp. ZIDIC5]